MTKNRNPGFFFFFGGGGGGGGEEEEDMNTRAAIFYHISYTRHILMTSSIDSYSLMRIFLKVFKIEGIVALTVKGR